MLVVVTSAVLVLAGCADSSALPELQRAQTDADKVAVQDVTTQFDAESSRFVGEDSRGAAYYLVVANDTREPCVLVQPAEGGWWSGWGGIGMKANGGYGTTVEIRDPASSVTVEPGVEQIGESLLVSVDP